MKKRVLVGLGYTALFMACFVLFSYLTLPTEHIKQVIIQEIQAPRGPDGTRRSSGWQVEIGDLDTSLLTGVDIESLHLTKLATEPDALPSDILFDNVHARISLLGLLMGSTDVSFEIEMAGGTIEGEVERSETEMKIVAELATVNLRQVGMVQSALGIPVEGIASGTIDVTLGAEPATTTGSVKLAIASLAIGNGRAQLKPPGMASGITLERLAAGDLALELAIEAGTARIAKLEGRGSDLELDGSGSIRLVQPLAMSRVDLLLRAKVLDAYRNRSDATRAIFELIEFSPQVGAAKTPDGAFQFRLSGGFGSLRGVAAGRARMPAPGATSRPPRGDPPEAPPP